MATNWIRQFAGQQDRTYEIGMFNALASNLTDDIYSMCDEMLADLEPEDFDSQIAYDMVRYLGDERRTVDPQHIRLQVGRDYKGQPGIKVSVELWYPIVNEEG